MNKIFKVIWNHATQSFVVVSELTKSKTKSSSTTDERSKPTMGNNLLNLGVGTATIGILGSVLVANVHAAVALSSPSSAGSAIAGTNSYAAGTNVNVRTGGSALFGMNSEIGNTDNSAINAVAVAVNSTINGARSASLGFNLTVTGVESVAVGTNATVSGGQAVGIGFGANATGEQSTAIGNDVRAEGYASVAIGSDDIDGAKKTKTTLNGKEMSVTDAYKFITNSTLIQTNATGDTTLYRPTNASGVAAVAIGGYAQSAGHLATAIGTNTTASGFASMAVGVGAKAIQTSALAMGSGAKANEINTIAIGTNATAAANISLAIGVNSIANGTHSVALGQASVATGNFANALGSTSFATEVNATAVGTGATSEGISSFAAGHLSLASNVNATAVGTFSTANATDSIAMGSGATVERGFDSAIAIGTNANATIKNSVALGSNATTTAAVNTNEATVNKLTYSGFAGNSPTSVVSVGSATEKRQIQNVAAGQISATSTDAINGSQLYATQQVLGNVADSIKTVLGGDAVVAPTGTITMNNIGDTNQNTIHKAIAAVKETVKEGKNTKVTPTVAANGSTTYKIDAVDTSASASAGSTALKVTPNGTKAVGDANVTDYAIDLSDETKANITHGVNANNTVTTKGLTFTADNVGQNTLRKLGQTLAINGDNSLVQTEVSEGKIKISATDKLTKAVDNATTALQSFVTTVDTTKDAQTITKGANKANFITGDNIQLTASNQGITIATKKDVTFDNVSTKNFTATGDTKLNNVTIAPNAKVDMGGNRITNVGTPTEANDAATKQYVDSGRTKVTSNDKSVTINKSEVNGADVYDLTVTANLNYTGDTGEGTNKLSDKVKFSGTADQIETTATNGNVNFKLASKVTDSLKKADSAIQDFTVGADKDNNAAGITLNQQDKRFDIIGTEDFVTTAVNGRNVKVDIAKKFKDAVSNNTQNIAKNADNIAKNAQNITNNANTIAKGFGLQAEDKNVVNKKLGENISVVGGNSNINTSVKDNKITINLNNTLNLTNAGSVKMGDTTVNKDGVTITGGPSVTKNGIDAGNKKITNVANGVNPNDAVNVSQLDKVNATAKAGWKLTVHQQKGNISTVTPNATVSLNNEDGNILITKSADNNNVTFALNSTLSVGGLGKDGQPGKDGVIGAKGANGKTGVTLNGKDGSIGINGKDGSNGTITLAKGKPGVDGKDGDTKTRIIYQPVDEKGNPKGTPEQVATLSDGLKFVGDVGDVIKKELNDTLTIKGNLSKGAEVTDKNLRVDNVNGALILKMAKSLQELTNATFVDNAGNRSVIDGNGLTITPKADSGKAPVSLTDKGLNNGGNQVTNVSSGLVDNKGQKVDLANAAGDVLNNAVNVGDLKNSINNLTNATTGGFGLTGDDGQSAKADLGKTVTVQGDGSVVTKVVKGKDGKDALQVGLSNDVTIGNGKEPGKITVKGENGKDGVVLNGKDGSAEFKDADGKTTVAINGKDGTIGLNGKDGVATKVDGNGVTITGGANGTVNLTDKGLNNGGNTITNVAAGVNATDAVNVSQLKDATAAATSKVEAGKNTVVTPTKNADGSTTYTVATKDEVDFTKVATGNTTMTNEGVKIGDLISLTENGLNNGGKKATNIADGDISATSKDAVNGSQLHATNQNVTNLQNTVAKGWNIEADTVDGSTGKVIGKSKAKVAMGDTVAVKAGNNIEITQEGKNIAIATSANPNFDSVKIGKGSNTAIISTTEDGAINVANANGGPTRITNVAAGKKDNDAVNVAQLKGAMSNINNNINAVNNKVDKVDRDLRAGIAGAMAAGNLYHVTIPGKSMVSAGIGTYKNQGAVAVGYSRLSDNGKIGVKFSVNTNTRGDSGAAASVGYQW
ncbi:ESPR-type extended signal peptide-containing protein [Actinobacillus equuli]|uniref:ESPR-type extended signal peptide-containing protein n=1 Tax=Actinobacillus equuli TaxID=718 RepID=UPI0024428F16|nr:YadA-like family protein [Actinobacillus equuli]WGE57167.1 YadA-like family protein [Actinobacillus equuli subsp. equuli]